jgi:hypothetical protein
MDAASDLTVDVVNDRDIVVMNPKTGFEVTYRRDGYYRMLVALDPMRDVRPTRLNFLAQAWTAAHDKAISLDWLDN